MRYAVVMGLIAFGVSGIFVSSSMTVSAETPASQQSAAPAQKSGAAATLQAKGPASARSASIELPTTASSRQAHPGEAGGSGVASAVSGNAASAMSGKAGLVDSSARGYSVEKGRAQ